MRGAVGSDGKTPPGIACEHAAEELGPAAGLVASVPGGVTLNLSGLRLRFQFADRLPANGPAQSPEDQLATLDADKNGYLEKKEVEKKSPEMAAMFDDWDGNGDGMVYPREIAAYERGRRAPLATAIRIAAQDDQDALFPWLDSDFDGRVTPRELRAAAARLSELDTDGDGQLALDEIPGGLTVQIERGAAMGSPVRSESNLAAAAPAADGPKWFAAMDSNRDREVSPREFPGNRQKFSQLDADGDGFISLAEATDGDKSEGSSQNSEDDRSKSDEPNEETGA